MLRALAIVTVCLSVYALPIGIAAQDLEATVSVDLSAMPISKALPLIEQKTGIHLKSSKATEDQVVVIKVASVKLIDLMNKLASATGAEWSKESDGYRLVRGLSLLQQQTQAETNERAAALAKSLAEMKKEADKVPNMDRSAAENYVKQSRGSMGTFVTAMGSGQRGGIRFSTGSDSGPASRAVVGILSLMPIGQLASIPAGTRVVFSTAPTRMQRAFPAGVDRVITRFVQEQRLVNQVLSETQDARVPAIFLGGGAQTSNTIPAKSILVVNRPPGSSTLMLQLIVGNSDGDAIATGSTGLSPIEVRPDASFLPKNPNDAVQLSDLSAQFAKLIQAADGGGGANFQILQSGGSAQMVFMTRAEPDVQTPAGPTPKDWRDRILNPEKYEPLGWVPSDFVISLGASERCNLIACLPDECLIPMCRAFAVSKMNLGPASKMAQEEWGLKFEVEGDWLTISPRHPVESRDTQIDRSGLGKMLRTLDANGRLKLDEMAAYALSQPLQAPAYGFDRVYARLINKPFADAELSQALSSEREMLRLYGLLGSAQRQALSAGRPLPLNGLTSDQLALTRSMVFDSMSGPVNTAPLGNRNRQQAIRVGAALAMMGQSLTQERTEFLPNGLPVNGFVTLAVNREQAVMASQSSGNGSQVMTVNSLAMTRALSSRTDLPAGLFNATQFDRYRIGTQLNYNFTFQLGPTASLSRSLRDATFDTQAQGVSYDQLPAGFRNNVQRATEQMANRVNRAPMPATGGSRTPPPLP